MSYLIVSWNSSGSGFTRQAFPPLKHVRFPLATPGTEACDAMGGAFRPQWRELPAIVLRLSLPCCPKRSRIDAKHGDHFLQADFAILIVGAMPGFCCVSSNKQQRRCNGCAVHSISKRNYEASRRNLSFLTFVSLAFVVSSVLQLSPAQSASRIPKPCDWLRKIRAHAGPDRATVARPDRGEPAPT